MDDRPATVNVDRLDAVIFGLDGVLTDTAQTHAACWKHTFDDFLRGYDRLHGTKTAPFDIRDDYFASVEGRSRRDGVRSFLGSRGIALPEGDALDVHTVTLDVLADRKNALFVHALKSHGVAPFKDAVELLVELRRRGATTAVVSPSANCGRVLDAARLRGRLDTWVEGSDLAALEVVDRVYPVLLGEAVRAARLTLAQGAAGAAREGGPGRSSVGVGRLTFR